MAVLKLCLIAILAGFLFVGASAAAKKLFEYLCKSDDDDLPPDMRFV